MPVLSIATCVRPCESIHSRKLNSSRVVVPKVRTASALFHLSEQLICRPPPWPDARPIHNRAPSEFAWLPPKEAIAAPQVCYRHCYASFPFPGVTKGDNFSDASQSLVRDRCRHSVKTTSKQSPITNACTTRLTPQSHDPGC